MDDAISRRNGSQLPDTVRRLLARLGDAIGGSVSSSDEVAEAIRLIESEGFHLYVVLDAKIGVDRDKKKALEAARRQRLHDPGNEEGSAAEGLRERRVIASRLRNVEFRMNLADALLLRSLGIDGTLRIRRARAAVDLSDR